MYSFFCDKKSIKKNPKDFLILCKRLLLRWINGILDNENIQIFRTISLIGKTHRIILKTGRGSSILIMDSVCMAELSLLNHY